MKTAVVKKTWLASIICIAIISFLLPFPMTCYGVEPCTITIDVSPYQVNIDSGGAEHYVRVLTYAWYSKTFGAVVYINENEDPIDSEYIVLTRDSVGHLVVKIDLIALQEAGLEEGIHDLIISVVLKISTGGCVEQKGSGEIYIIGKKGGV